MYVFMEIDQRTVTVRPVRGFEVEMFDAGTAFVLGNCLNDLSGVWGHTTTELIQGMLTDLTDSRSLYASPCTPPCAHKSAILFLLFISLTQ